MEAPKETVTATDREIPVVRMMLNVQIPVDAGNKAIENGKAFADTRKKN